MFFFERQVSISFIISIAVHICLLGFMYHTHVQLSQETIIITDIELIEPLPEEEEILSAKEVARVIPFWKAPQQATVELLKKIKLIPTEPAKVEEKEQKALEIEKSKIQAPLIKEEEKPIEIKDELKRKTLTELYEKTGEKIPDIIELPKKKITLEQKTAPIITQEKSIHLEEVGEKQVEVKRVIRPGKPMLESFKQIPEETIRPEQLLEKSRQTVEKRVIPLPRMQQEEGMVNLHERQETKPIGMVKKKRVIVVPAQKTFMPKEEEPEKKAEIAIEKKPVKKPEVSKPVVKPAEVEEEPKEAQKVEDKLKSLKKEGASTMTIIGPLSKRPKIRAPRPEYPAWAEKKGIESQVVIYFTVTPDGMVNPDAYVELTSGYAGLDQLAMQTLKGWRFAPLSMDAEQKDQWGKVTFKFVLQ
ncbi:TonB family protein [Candidatus Desantisbacteria bacterium]|nr:TonB family protein [Candidatus Desantisbacteria bacterium]